MKNTADNAKKCYEIVEQRYTETNTSKQQMNESTRSVEHRYRIHA